MKKWKMGFGLQFIITMLLLSTMTFGATVGANHPTTGAYSPVSESTWGGATFALGANSDGTNATFAVYSKNATNMLLEIYTSATGTEAKYDYWMKKGSDNVWRAKVAGVPNKAFYAFRAWGPNWPYSNAWVRGNNSAGFVSDVDVNGNRFNPNKVLYDPYTKEMSHDKETPAMKAAGENGGMFGTGGTDINSSQTYKGPITNNVAINRRNVDTGKWAPKSILVIDSTSFGTKPKIAQKDAIIYEAHVRGLTNHSSVTSLQTILTGIPGFETVANVPAAYKGTYKGAGYMAKYLKGLGFNTIELLPVHETANDVNPDTSPGGNFWGYMTYGYFAPDRRYSYDKTPGGPTKEFKEMVKSFHDVGIEVYLDVVFNHTGEGGNWDATKKVAEITSFRGLDNSTYYALVGTDKASYWETTGCGNNVNCNNPQVRKMVIDSLTYWLDSMGVDGFRFDLAPVLGRQDGPNYNFSSASQTLKDIATLGSGKNAEMIAEAWDCGTYQVGNFPSGWGEWNGFYRDTIRRFIKGTGDGSAFADKFNGSYNNFNSHGGPQKSVNFIVAHDGFTLMDLVSYNGKMNNSLTWPFGPSDGGSDSNDSWDSSGNQALRRQQLRNLWTIQMFSRGVPMAVYGDEFGRTQNGNNNPYNIDSIGTWNNYNMINSDTPNSVLTGSSSSYHNNFGTDESKDNKNNLFLYVKNLLSVRNKHVALRQDNYNVSYTFRKADDSNWITSTDRAVRIYIQGSTVGDSNFLVFVNTWTVQVPFKVSTPTPGKKWVRLADTDRWAEGTSNNFWAVNPAVISGSYGVNPWSVVVLEEVAQ